MLCNECLYCKTIVLIIGIKSIQIVNKSFKFIAYGKDFSNI